MFPENITLISAVYFINPKTLENAAFCKTKNNGTRHILIRTPGTSNCMVSPQLKAKIRSEKQLFLKPCLNDYRASLLSLPLLLTRMWDRQTLDSVTAQSKHALCFSTGVFSRTFCYVLSFLSVSTTSPTRPTSFIALVWERNTRNSTKLRLSVPLTDCVSCAVLSPETHCSQRPQGEFKEASLALSRKLSWKYTQ